MSYVQADIEVTRPLRSLRLPVAAEGVALRVWRDGRLVGFVMEPLSPGTVDLPPARIGRILAPHVASRLVLEGLRDELMPVSARGPASLPPVTLAICTRDRPDRVGRLLDSLAGLRTTTGHAPPRRLASALDVLVVDNAPSDRRTAAVVTARAAGFPHPLRYVCEPRPGLDIARNRALAEATGGLLAFLDDDVAVHPGWLDGLAAAHADNPDAAAFTGLVLPLELETPAQVLFEQRGGFRRGFDRLRYHGQDLPGNPLYPCGAGLFGAGANMVFRRRTLLELGGFDEALDTGRDLPGGGDLDIFYRVIRAGHPLVYEPRCLVLHEHRRDLAGLRRQYWSWGLGFMAFVCKSRRNDPGMRRRFRALVLWWFGDQLRQLRHSVRGRHPLPPSMLLAELWGGVQGLCGEYGRSRRRVERARRRAAQAPDAAARARIELTPARGARGERV